jgi:hypothetical protein
VATPTVRVGVFVRKMLEEEFTVLQVFDEYLVSLFEELSTDQWNRALECAIATYWIDDG